MRESATLPLLLKELRLTTMLQSWEKIAEEVEEQSDSCIKFLSRLCELEVCARYSKRINRFTKESRLPTGKTLATFDFKHARLINKGQIESLSESCQWAEKAENILIFGPSGVGKSHLAAAIGHCAIEQGIRTYFTQTSVIVQQLQLARKNFELPQALAKLSKYHLLILDDIGYAKKDESETSVLFDLIADRYESGSLIITANQAFSEWDQIFPDNMMAVASIDRLVHHASIIKIDADSYRKIHAKTKQDVKNQNIVGVKEGVSE